MGDHLGIPGARGFLPTRRGPLAPAARPDSWIPPAAPRPPGRGERWPGPRLPLQTWVASARPASPSAFAFGFQDTRRRPAVPSPSGAPLACLRQSGACTDSSQSPSPRPTPCLAGHRACACAHARTDRCAQTGHLSCSLIPWFLREPPYSFPYRLYPCPFLLTVEESSLCSTSSPALVIDRHRSEAQSDSCEVVPPWSLELSLSNH
ncbi:unnamed protein product [Ceratitis capitata]|uniref:(Mediterranean fruit fly) hypothetical protein n=1 Tax=Ceratitis capitata TaxID=7213 RepID=A0A811VJQ4_CERCA|nr:unnamed protein product [Ceratitis capitata]